MKSRSRALRAVIALSLVALAAIAYGVTTALTPSPSGIVSGRALPPATLPGWREVYYDNFTNSSLGSAWSAYSGQPGGDPNGWWSPSHVVVSNGEVVLRTYRASTPHGSLWTSGGMGMHLARTYGKYEVRMRVSEGKGISAIALLWPQVGWPPEVDFYEDSPTGNQRDRMSATLHYSSANETIQRSLASINFTKWHTLGVEWTPNRLVYTIDGRPWATLSGHEVPDRSMVLDIQTQALDCKQSSTCPGATTPREVDMDIDWVAIYAPS